MRAPEWHTTKHARTPLYGRKLEHGDRIEQGDLYDSTTGHWTQHPCVGSEVSGQHKLATTVRPVDTLSVWADAMGDEDLPTVPLGKAFEAVVLSTVDAIAALDHKVELSCGYTTVPQEMLDDGVPLIDHKWQPLEAENLGEMERAVEPLDSFEAFGGPQLARALDDRHRPTSAIGGVKVESVPQPEPPDEVA